MNALHGILARFIPYGFSVSLRNSDYLAYYRYDPLPKKSPLDSRYGVCFRSVLWSIMFSYPFSTGVGNEFHFLIERGHKNLGAAEKIFFETKDIGTPSPVTSMFKSMDVGEKKDYAGLQAADLMAFSAFAMEYSAIALQKFPSMPPIPFSGRVSVPKIYRTNLDKKALMMLRGNAMILNAARISYGKNRNKTGELPILIGGIVRTGDANFPYEVEFKEDNIVVANWPTKTLASAYAEISAMYDAIGGLMWRQSGRPSPPRLGDN